MKLEKLLSATLATIVSASLAAQPIAPRHAATELTFEDKASAVAPFVAELYERTQTIAQGMKFGQDGLVQSLSMDGKTWSLDYTSGQLQGISNGVETFKIEAARSASTGKLDALVLTTAAGEVLRVIDAPVHTSLFGPESGIAVSGNQILRVSEYTTESAREAEKLRLLRIDAAQSMRARQALDQAKKYCIDSGAADCEAMKQTDLAGCDAMQQQQIAIGIAEGALMAAMFGPPAGVAWIAATAIAASQNANNCKARAYSNWASCMSNC